MREPLIVLWPTSMRMVDEMLPRRGIKALKILIREGLSQQFRLIEPAGVWGCIERLKAPMAGGVGLVS